MMLDGKVVIVTGGAKGVGRYASRTLALEGAKVAIADIDTERLHRTVKELRETRRDQVFC